MRFTFEKNKSAIAKLRRKVRKSRFLTVRVTNGKTFLMLRPVHADTKSEAQLKCRERFKKAQELMKEDFNNAEKVRYWKKRANRLGYKTAKGCARAYYMERLKEEEEKALKTSQIENIVLTTNANGIIRQSLQMNANSQVYHKLSKTHSPCATAETPPEGNDKAERQNSE